ncbi:Nif11 family protein [Azorhizobium doebereinerae]|uniref:Nif11 family protein n=1 Tax=Azorhizobium doebereinerae TaxID=281091 RepID=UPI00041DB75E|nr:Nif11 family protein [Azorhizobium doebereinerae]
MSQADLERLKADASGNTGLAEVLMEAIPGFASPEDAVNFLATRGFEISTRELTDAAATEARQDTRIGKDEGAYGALLRFMVER